MHNEKLCITGLGKTEGIKKGDGMGWLSKEKRGIVTT